MLVSLVGADQLVALLSQVKSPNGHAGFKTGSAYLLWEFQLWRAETSVPQVQHLCSSSPPHQSERRILQRSSNIPLYIFEALSDHGADRGSLGDEIAPCRHSFLSPQIACSLEGWHSGCLCFFFYKNHLQFPLNGIILVRCIHGGQPCPQFRLLKDLCVMRMCVCVYSGFFLIMDVQICCSSSRLFPPAVQLSFLSPFADPSAMGFIISPWSLLLMPSGNISFTDEYVTQQDLRAFTAPEVLEGTSLSCVSDIEKVTDVAIWGNMTEWHCLVSPLITILVLLESSVVILLFYSHYCMFFSALNCMCTLLIGPFGDKWNQFVLQIPYCVSSYKHLQFKFNVSPESLQWRSSQTRNHQ